MIDPHTIQGCRWAEATLFQDTPLWISSDEFPWTCALDGRLERVEDTARCRMCLRWMPRTRAGDKGIAFLESR